MSKRQPEGIPTGGQFAPDRKGEPRGSLLERSTISTGEEVFSSNFFRVQADYQSTIANALLMKERLSDSAVAILGIMTRRTYPNARQVEIEVEQNVEDDGSHGRPVIVAAVDADGRYIDQGSDGWTRKYVPQDGGMAPDELTEYLRPDASWGEPEESRDAETGIYTHTYRVDLPAPEPS